MPLLPDPFPVNVEEVDARVAARVVPAETLQPPKPVMEHQNPNPNMQLLMIHLLRVIGKSKF